MNKYLISTGIVLASLTTVSANEVATTVSADNVVYTTSVMASPTAKPGKGPNVLPSRVMGNTAVAARAMPLNGDYQMDGVMTTGDATTDTSIDAEIKALEKEMEAKIKVIRDEYQAKIKVIIGNRKMLNQQKMASSSERMMKGSSSMPVRDMMMRKASTTNQNSIPMRKEGGQGPVGQVKGESMVGTGTPFSEKEGGVRGLFGRFFGK